MKEKWFCNEHLTFFFNGQTSEALEHLWADRNIIQNSEFWCQNWFAYSCICQTIFQHAVYCQQKKTVSPAWVSWMCVQIRNSQTLMCVIMHWTVNEFHFQWKSSCPSSRCNILISTQFMCDLYFEWLIAWPFTIAHSKSFIFFEK